MIDRFATRICSGLLKNFRWLTSPAGKYILLVALGIFAPLGLASFLVYPLPTILHYGGLFALSIYVAWWVVYLWKSEACRSDDPSDCEERWDSEVSQRPVVTARTFLEFKTARGVQTDDGEALVRKAEATINTVGIIVGFSLLIFTLNTELLLTNRRLSQFETGITTLTLVTQITAIVLFVIAIDSLTGTLNHPITLSTKERYDMRHEFYKRGVKNYYYGLIVLLFSVFLFTLTIHPLVVIIGVLLFTSVGFDYWFDYTNRSDYTSESATAQD